MYAGKQLQMPFRAGVKRESLRPRTVGVSQLTGDPHVVIDQVAGDATRGRTLDLQGAGAGGVPADRLPAQGRRFATAHRSGGARSACALSPVLVRVADLSRSPRWRA